MDCSLLKRTVSHFLRLLNRKRVMYCQIIKWFLIMSSNKLYFHECSVNPLKIKRTSHLYVEGVMLPRHVEYGGQNIAVPANCVLCMWLEAGHINSMPYYLLFKITNCYKNVHFTQLYSKKFFLEQYTKIHSVN